MSADATVLFDAPGPKARQRHLVVTIVAIAALLAAVAATVYGLREQLAPQKWAPFAEAPTWALYILPGIIGTLQAAAISVVTAGILGLLLGAGRLAPSRIISVPAGVIVEFFRAVPVLIMMLFAYYVFLFSGLLQGYLLLLVSVVFGLTFYNAAVIAELVRSGVHSLPRGQGEAGLAIGLTTGQTLAAIQMPQAIRAMLPSVVSQLVVVLKDSALGYMIGYAELLRSAQTLASVRSNLIVAFIVAAAIFILLNYALTSIAHWLEGRMARRTAGDTTATPMIEQAGTI